MNNAINVATLSGSELTALIEASKAQIANIEAERVANVRSQINELLTTNNLTLAALFPEFAPAAAPVEREVRKVAAKYRSADGQEWTGRGLKPLWVTAYLATPGNTLESLLIVKPEAPATDAGAAA